jgi:hypothetical protein
MLHLNNALKLQPMETELSDWSWAEFFVRIFLLEKDFSSEKMIQVADFSRDFLYSMNLNSLIVPQEKLGFSLDFLLVENDDM